MELGLNTEGLTIGVLLPPKRALCGVRGMITISLSMAQKEEGEFPPLLGHWLFFL
jgi:hypothetical protein